MMFPARTSRSAPQTFTSHSRQQDFDTLPLVERIDAALDAASDLGSYLAELGPDVIARAWEIWGGIECNECGGVLKEERLKFCLPGDDRWNAEVIIAVSPNGWWAMPTALNYDNGGRSSPMSIFDTTAYASRQDAISAGIDELIDQFEQLSDYHDSYQHTTRLGCERMIK